MSSSLRCNSVICAAILSVTALAAGAAAQGGWIKAGSHPADYEMGNDSTTAFTGTSSGFIRSTKPETGGFGTYMQMVDAAEYRGKRVRLTVYVKADNVAAWSGVWMRVDAGAKAIAFDNMQSRPIKGSQNWAPHSVVLDVANSATALAFGVLLAGTGAVWMDDVALEVVGNDVPVTDSLSKVVGQPRNLDFESTPTKQ